MMQITKGLAQKMYERGEEIMILPDKMKVNDKMATWVRKENEAAPDFGKLCDIVFHYNCNPKAGMKLMFYAKEVN